MKYYKSVIIKVEEYNYKKGVNRLDTESGGYKACKILYYIAFVWFAALQFMYLSSNTVALLFYKRSAQIIDMPLYITFWAATVLVVAGFVFVKMRWHIAAFAVNTVAPIAEMIMLHRNDDVSLRFLEGGILNNRYFWSHYFPGGLIILFTLIICIIGVKSHIQFKKDYSVMLQKMYNEYSQKVGTVSDVMWQEYLEQADAQLLNDGSAKSAKKRKKK